MSYRWSSPHEWLEEASQKWDAARLQHELHNLARLLDCDQLQDEFQSEMDADGYFREEETEL